MNITAKMPHHHNQYELKLSMTFCLREDCWAIVLATIIVCTCIVKVNAKFWKSFLRRLAMLVAYFIDNVTATPPQR